jgi:spore maturation protein CgeB
MLEMSYGRQYAALMADGFALANSWERYLNGGNVGFQVTEIVVNAEYLQKRWAVEHGLRYRESEWQEDIFLAQVRDFSPDLIYAHAPEVGPELRRCCREICKPGLRIITYDGIGRHNRSVTDGADAVITCLRESRDFYRNAGLHAYWMMFGFDPCILKSIDHSLPRSNISFIGGLQVRIGHQERANVLCNLASHFPVDFWISGLPDDGSLIRYWASFIKHKDWDGFLKFFRAGLNTRRLRAMNRGELFGLRMFSQLAASNFTLNVHIAAAGNQAANIRLFEATGVGTCLVTDWKDNISELFEPDREIVVFRSPEEAVEKVLYLMNHETERLEIAKRGQNRTLVDHCYSDRLAEVVQFLEEVLRGK